MISLLSAHAPRSRGSLFADHRACSLVLPAPSICRRHVAAWFATALPFLFAASCSSAGRDHRAEPRLGSLPAPLSARPPTSSSARKHITQVQILHRAATTLVVVVTAGAALMTFDSVREFGLSLFASAGVASIVVGLAARPVLSNLLAGVQLAITQPIRIDDTVVVEGEFGTIEEIGSSYVLIRLWDLGASLSRSYFMEKPFQNWTRQGSAILGAAMLYLDYTAPSSASAPRRRRSSRSRRSGTGHAQCPGDRHQADGSKCVCWWARRTWGPVRPARRAAREADRFPAPRIPARAAAAALRGRRC